MRRFFLLTTISFASLSMSTYGATTEAELSEDEVFHIPITQVRSASDVNVESLGFGKKGFSVGVDGKKVLVQHYDVEKEMRGLTQEGLKALLSPGNKIFVGRSGSDLTIDTRKILRGGMHGAGGGIRFVDNRDFNLFTAELNDVNLQLEGKKPATKSHHELQIERARLIFKISHVQVLVVERAEKAGAPMAPGTPPIWELKARMARNEATLMSMTRK